MKEQIVSVNDARRLLGPKYDRFTDEDIRKMIEELNDLAEIILDQLLHKDEGREQ